MRKSREKEEQENKKVKEEGVGVLLRILLSPKMDGGWP